MGVYLKRIVYCKNIKEYNGYSEVNLLVNKNAEIREVLNMKNSKTIAKHPFKH